MTMTMTKIIDELQFPRCELAKHFHNISRDDLAFVRNPYLVAGTDLINIFNGDDDNQYEFIAPKMIHLQKKILSAYWSAMVFSYPRVASAANRVLMPFLLTWLCEAGFSALFETKNKTRNKLIVKPDHWCAPPTIGPRIGKRVV